MVVKTYQVPRAGEDMYHVRENNSIKTQKISKKAYCLIIL